MMVKNPHEIKMHGSNVKGFIPQNEEWDWTRDDYLYCTYNKIQAE